MHVSWNDRHVAGSHPASPCYQGPTSLTTQYMGLRRRKHTGQPGGPSTQLQALQKTLGSEQDRVNRTPFSGLGWLLPEQLVSKG